MSQRVATSLPVPHLFMALSLGIFALMAVLALGPGAASETSPVAAGSETAPVAAVSGQEDGVVMAMDAGLPILASAPTAGSPAHPGSAVVTLAALFALLSLVTAIFRAGRMRSHGAGRPILGLLAGLLAGAAGAASLFSLGVIPLASPAWIYLPLVLATLGTSLGWTAPFGRGRAV